jgi:hypothetical protein
MSSSLSQRSLFAKQQHLQEDEDDFLRLYQDASTEGLGLAREFNRQQQQRQFQLQKERKRLSQTYDTRITSSAGFFNTGNTVVRSVPQIYDKKQVIDPNNNNNNINNNDDNWLLIFATSMVTQSSQQVMVLQQKDQQQQIMISLTALLFIASLIFILSMGDNPNVGSSSMMDPFSSSSTVVSSILEEVSFGM